MMKKLNPNDILNGTTASYIDVFGTKSGITLGTELNGIKYHIYDRYCMNPSCKCEEVILYYEGYREGVNEIEVDFGVALSLKNKKFVSLDPDSILKKGAVEVVKHSLKDSNDAIELFKKRYKEMKVAGRAVIQGSDPNKIKIEKPSQATPKRNDPCSCGSGKKYKKCCSV
jgi:hypothetical protein